MRYTAWHAWQDAPSRCAAAATAAASTFSVERAASSSSVLANASRNMRIALSFFWPGHGDRGRGRSVHLPAPRATQRWSLKLTASTPAAWACWGSGPGVPRRCSDASPLSRPPGSARAGPTATSAAARAYRFRDPDGHVFELYYECERYSPPPAPPPGAQERARPLHGRGCAIKRLDHINILAADVRANRDFCVDALGYRLYERSSSTTAARPAPG